MLSFCLNNPRSAMAITVAFAGVSVKMIGSKDRILISIVGAIFGALGNFCFFGANFKNCLKGQPKFLDYKHLWFNGKPRIIRAEDGTIERFEDVWDSRVISLLKTALITSPTIGMVSSCALYTAENFNIIDISPLEILITTVACTMLSYLMVIKYFDYKDENFVRNFARYSLAENAYKQSYFREINEALEDVLPYDVVEILIGGNTVPNLAVTDLPPLVPYSIEFFPRSLSEINKVYLKRLTERALDLLGHQQEG